MTQERLNTIKLIVLAIAVWSAAIFVTPPPSGRTALATNEQAKTAATTANDEKVVWLDNYEAALKEAKATGKPIFLEFRCAP
jgi:thiol:disulfide interchange protein